MASKQGTWGLYQWFEEQGEDQIHPNDLDLVRQLMPNGKVFQSLGEKEGFLHLRYGDTEFRVLPSLFKPLPLHPRAFGEEVTLRDGSSGTIIGILWHFKREEPFYQLRVEGKKKAKRYWEPDFV